MIGHSKEDGEEDEEIDLEQLTGQGQFREDQVKKEAFCHVYKGNVVH